MHDKEVLRPTADRVRETLFNWLQNFIEGAHCLDLFAGTGALGFEAASRGAASVTLVENDRALCDQLTKNINTLSAENVKLVQTNALSWLQGCSQKFDLVFLDPPFEQGLVEKSCDLLRTKDCVDENGLIYIESEVELQLPEYLEIIKQGKAGHVKYLLARLDNT